MGSCLQCVSILDYHTSNNFRLSSVHEEFPRGKYGLFYIFLYLFVLYSICLVQPQTSPTRSPKQEYQWPQKWTCVQQFFFLKKIPYLPILRRKDWQ